MARPKTSMVQASLRLPEELWERAERYAAELTEADPEMTYSRTDAIRKVLDKYLPPLRIIDGDDKPASPKGAAPKPPKKGGGGSAKP